MPTSQRNITHAEIKTAIHHAYEQLKDTTGGRNASYIPYLEKVDTHLFAISVCLIDGTVISAGDARYPFGIESLSKVPTAILAMRQCGSDAVLRQIGANATGLPFDSIMAMLLENGPATPLVNAGAIAAVSMVKPQGDAQGKWEAITKNMAELAGSELTLIEDLYRSERANGYNNRSITWLLKDRRRIYDDPEMTLELYTRQCSLAVTTEQLSIMAATIANDGFNPVTDTVVFDEELAPKVTSLITTAGFYQHTGDWLYQSDIPAKSGVGGGILGVMPGMFGIAAFSPPLDDAGNSVKAQRAVESIMKELDLNIFAASRLCVVD